MHRYVFAGFWGAMIVLLAGFAQADDCFNARGKVTEDAQLIRKTARELGWVVGKTTSLTAAGVVDGKKQIYPLDSVEVCLRVEGGKLQIKAQSKAKDAGEAGWHELPAKKASAPAEKKKGDRSGSL